MTGLDFIVAGALIANFVWVLPQVDFGTYAPLYGYSGPYALLITAICICIVLFCLFAIWRVVIGWRAAAWLYVIVLVGVLLIDAGWRYGLGGTPGAYKLVWTAAGRASAALGLADAVAAALVLRRVLLGRGEARA